MKNYKISIGIISLFFHIVSPEATEREENPQEERIHAHSSVMQRIDTESRRDVESIRDSLIRFGNGSVIPVMMLSAANYIFESQNNALIGRIASGYLGALLAKTFASPIVADCIVKAFYPEYERENFIIENRIICNSLNAFIAAAIAYKGIRWVDEMYHLTILAPEIICMINSFEICNIAAGSMGVLLGVYWLCSTE